MYTVTGTNLVGTIRQVQETLGEAKIAADDLLQNGFKRVEVRDERDKVVWRP